MKIGIIGLPQAGKSTIFAALTGARGAEGDHSSRKDLRIAVVTVFDDRIDFLSRMYQPKKTTYAKIEYLLPPETGSAGGAGSEGAVWNQIRTCDALLHVVRNFEGTLGTSPTSEQDFRRLEEEMILNDLVVAEKRMERIELDRKRGKAPEAEETSLVQACGQVLERGMPLRSDPGLASAPLLKGFAFLSAKPMLILVNNDDEDETPPIWDQRPEGVDLFVVRGSLEKEIASLPVEEAKVFLEAYHIQESALDRVIRHSFHILNRISFFTVGLDEVRAWPIPEGTPALEAAGSVHSDIQQGFIRAEVVAYEDLKTHGGFNEAKKAGLVRLEGKGYQVKDGDIITFRFNV
jgi:GTP-binding protein YchF